MKSKAQMAAEAEHRMVHGTPQKDDNTFLTDVFHGKKRDTDSEYNIDEELRDVVFDYETSQHLVAMADNYLHESTKEEFPESAP